MIDEMTRSKLLAAGWRPPLVNDFEPWREFAALYNEARGYPGIAKRLREDDAEIGFNDREVIIAIAYARHAIPPEEADGQA